MAFGNASPRRIAIIGNSLPRRCGIATFTSDLQHAIATSGANLESCIVAMTDHGQVYDYPQEVSFQIGDDNVQDYVRAADFLNTGQFDIVSLQHEFGIFGGEAGSHILLLLSRLNMPIVTTLHTVLAKPTAAQRAVLQQVVDLSSKVIVMAKMGSDLLRSIYQVSSEKIEIIAHGIPDFAFVPPDAAKARLGFSGRSVILTFGLLSPNKGIEVMIDAMPSILARRADAVYVVLGATHPNLVRDQGETYRESLIARVHELGVEDHVVFLDQFVEQSTLLEFISACDVYATPYLDEAQMTSGTLSYSFGLGKPVVSTPYWHARELLAEGRGVLVPFGDAPAIGREIAALLTDDTRRQRMCSRAYAVSRKMTWAELPTVISPSLRSFGGRTHLSRFAIYPGFSRNPLARAARDADRGIFFRCAMTLASSSMRYIRYPTGGTVIVSTTTRELCSWPAPSTVTASSGCPKSSQPVSPPSCSMRGIPTPDDFGTSWGSIATGLRPAARRTAMAAPCGPWVNAHAEMIVCRGVNGPLLCLRKRCRPPRPFCRRALGHSHY